jgi:hypothetical protein
VGSTFPEFIKGGPAVLLLYNIENYALEVHMERLAEAAAEIAGKAVFGHMNTQNNEVPIEIPNELPAFVAVGKNGMKVYGRDVRVSLAEWIRALIDSSEL